MTIEEKVQRYNEALERARIWQEYLNESGDKDYAEELSYIFPELKENEDEKIRKEIISIIHYAYGTSNRDKYNKLIAWLEKQDKKELVNFDEAEKEKSDFVGDGFIKCFANFLDFKEGETYWLEYIGDDKYNVRSDNLLGKTYHITPCQLYTVFKKLTWLEKQGEQKSADKAKPKFKVGDWIIFAENHNSVYQVERIDSYSYYLRHYLGGTLSVHFDNELIRLWTIEDAKKGDVLASKNGGTILIFRNLDNNIVFSSYYNTAGMGKLGWSNNRFIPATKEQRDQLEKAMTDAGYIFDFEKKELKKIEQKPVSITDEWIEDYWQAHKRKHRHG